MWYVAVADPQFLGTVFARRSGSTAWVELAGFGDSDCWLGFVPNGDTDIEFMLQTAQTDYIGPLTIQVYVLHDDGFIPPMPFMLTAWTLDCAFWAGAGTATDGLMTTSFQTRRRALPFPALVSGRNGRHGAVRG